MPSQRRVYRVAEKIRDLIAMELNRVADPRFSLVTISSVIVSPDLRHARVYWMVSGGAERRGQVDQAFQSAEGLFKRVLAKELKIRFVPELKFFYDDTLDTCEEVERLMEKIHPGPDRDPQSEDE